jgi:ATP-binding cassette subfamily B multidrug efflux pump
MSFITYITQILMSLTMLSMTIMTMSRAGASSERILEVLNTRSDIQNLPAAKEDKHVKTGKVEFKNVFFKYHQEGNEYVLKNINFTIKSGETVAIIGSTGSAKSTLVQLIPRLYDASKGDVCVDDVNVRDYTLQNLRAGVSLVLQKNELFSGTIKQNLQWGDEFASDEAIIAASKDAQAHEFIMSFPNQYETVLGQGGVNVSGGQKQRLCIARAILKKPAIIILDDSTSAIDVATESRIWQSFREHLRGITIIVIAQRISSILGSDKIMLLGDGEIIGMGTHSELLKTNGIYQEIYNSQQLQNAHDL